MSFIAGVSDRIAATGASMPPRALGARVSVVYVTSAATLVIAVLVIAGWAIGSEVLIALGPGRPSMKFNTAMCFGAFGTGGVLALHGHARAAVLCGVLIVAISITTQLEYIFNVDLGIDHLIFDEFSAHPDAVAGRMSPVTAILFGVIGTGLAVLSRQPASQWRSTAAGLGAGLTAGVALSALIAYATEVPGIHVVQVWGYVARVSPQTAIAFLLSGISLGALAAREGEKPWPSWIPIAGALTGLACTLTLSLTLFLEGGPSEQKALLSQWFTALGATLSVVMAIALHAARQARVQRDFQAQALAERERALSAASRLAAIVEASGDAIFSVNLKGEIIVWNRGAEDLYGYSAAEMVGHSVEILVPSEIMTAHRAMRARVREGQETRAMRTRRVRKGGRVIDVEVTVSPIRDALGDVVAAASFARDITERIESERMIEGILESAPDAIVIVDAEGHIVTVNRMAEQLFGYPRAELIGRPIAILLPEEVWPSHQEHRERYIATHAAGPAGEGRELSGQRHDGSRFPAEMSLSTLELPNRTLVISVMRDITARKQAADALRASEARLRLAIDAAGLGYWSYDLATGALRFDENCAAFYGMPASSIRRARDTADRVHPEDREHLVDALKTATQTGAEYHNEFRVVQPDGSIRWLLSVGRVVPAAQAPDTFAGVNMDVTRRKEAERELIELLHEKEVLLKEIHHRVKNNLHVVASLLSLQADAVGDPHLHAILDECRGRVASMALVHEKLYGTSDIGRIDFGQLARELTTAVVSTSERLGAEIGLEFLCEPVWLDIQRAVPAALILNELVTNALKHAFVGRERGCLTIAAQRNDGGLELRVTDDGVGLPHDGPGERARKSLGMTIVRNLVRQLDARMTVTSESGADFRILVPVGEA